MKRAKAKPAKPLRAWALVEKGKLTLLIYGTRMSLSDWARASQDRRIARVEIREVVRKKPRGRETSRQTRR